MKKVLGAAFDIISELEHFIMKYSYEEILVRGSPRTSVEKNFQWSREEADGAVILNMA